MNNIHKKIQQQVTGWSGRIVRFIANQWLTSIVVVCSCVGGGSGGSKQPASTNNYRDRHRIRM